MNVANAIYNATALVFSFAAIIISAVSARRQTRDARRGNVMLFMTELGQRIRSHDFREAQNYVFTELSKFDPSLGLYRLPEPACEHALTVGGFYQTVGLLTVTGVIDEDLALALYYTGIKESWKALEPYIQGERALRHSRGAGSVFGSFEHLAVYADSVSHDQIRKKFLHRSFPATAPARPSPDGSTDNVPATEAAPPSGQSPKAE